MPKTAYRTDADAKVMGVANLLVVDKDMDEALVRAILTTIFDNKPDLEKVHAEAKNLTLQSAVEGSPIDFHAGAIAYYKDKGVWKK
ncbi:MAG: hypothetical protein HYU87_07125 [Chloroflexi bacterium]|nr:hypothetical protein [Chloroflexota bacterium]